MDDWGGAAMIEAYSFGRMKVNGATYSDDIMIIDGNVKENWRRKRGHYVDMADVRDILMAKPDVLVLGKGRSGMMDVASSLSAHLAESGMELIAENTAEAVHTFNQLWREGRKVAAGFHLTC